VLGAARQGGGRHDQRAGIPSARFSECCTLRGTHTPTTGVPGGSTSCCRVGGAGGFPPRHCVLRSTSLDQHHCRDTVEYIILNSQRSCQHHCVTQPTNLPHNPCDWCHQQGVPLTCLRGILPQHDIVRHTCPCPCPCQCCRCVRGPQLGNDNGAPSHH